MGLLILVAEPDEILDVLLLFAEWVLHVLEYQHCQYCEMQKCAAMHLVYHMTCFNMYCEHRHGVSNRNSKHSESISGQFYGSG